MKKAITAYHRIDRIVAIALAVAFLASVTYFFLFRYPALPNAPNRLVFFIFAFLLSAAFSGVITFSIWKHRRWAFGLNAALHAFAILSAIFFTVVKQVSDTPLPASATTIFDWHDMYNLPITAYCAYRYLTYSQLEEPFNVNGESDAPN